MSEFRHGPEDAVTRGLARCPGPALGPPPPAAGLRSLRHGRTSFVIAPGLSTIRNADQILEMEAGEIVERGDHRSLMISHPRYHQFHDGQFHADADRLVNPGEAPATAASAPEPIRSVPTAPGWRRWSVCCAAGARSEPGWPPWIVCESNHCLHGVS